VYLSYPADWAPAKTQFHNAFDLVTPAEAASAGLPKARLNITAERRMDHAEALQRLHEIADGLKNLTGSAPKLLQIAGWPALQHQYTMPVPISEHNLPAKGGPSLSRRVTVAVAAADRLVLLEATFALDADPGLVGEGEKIAGTLRPPQTGNPAQSESEIQMLLRSLETPPPVSPRTDLRPGVSGLSRASFGSTAPVVGLAASPTNGELEVAVSNDGRDVVLPIDASTVQFSNTFGRSFAPVGPIANQCGSGGDPSITLGPNGGPSGVFYYAYLRDSQCAGGDRDTVGVAVSTDHGKTFAFRSNAVPLVVGGPDQEHIAADPRVVPGGNDQVYVVYRNLSGPDMQRSLMTCSADSGKTWSAPAQVGAADGDFPRITVGPDGIVYVVNRSTSTNAITISRYLSCSIDPNLTGLPRMPKIVDSVVDSPVCPIPGLDRCNAGNTMSSWMVAVDGTNANHVYLAFSKNSRPGNEDIVV